MPLAPSLDGLVKMPVIWRDD